MIDEPEDKDLEVEVPEVETPSEPVEHTEPGPETETDSQEEPTEPVDDVVVSIAGEEPDEEDKQPAPQWVRDVRKKNRELQRENRELQDRIKAANPVEQVALGTKPTLETCDFDTNVYESQLEQWYNRKREVEDRERVIRQQQETEQQAWNQKVNNYAAGKQSFGATDYDEAEAVVNDTFSIAQQGILLQGSENPVQLIYALGKNPKKAKELAELKDPVQFSFAVAKLETRITVEKKKSTPPPPERRVSGTGAMSGTVDSSLERLRAEAAKTGDFTKVLAYKNQLKNKQ
jgi:uncharacterized membrane protein